MKTQLLLLVISILSLASCKKEDLNIADLNQNDNINVTTRSTENIDQNLLKLGAKINLYVNEKNEVTATFKLPTPNTNEIVSWWFEWHYIMKPMDGVKSCNDKTLKFTAYCDSNVSLSIQCTKPNGVKSEVMMTGAKVSMFYKKTMAVSIY